MPFYQLYHYSEGRHFEHTDRFHAPTDGSALLKARDKEAGHDMELLCGHRRVAVLDVANSGAEA